MMIQVVAVHTEAGKNSKQNDYSRTNGVKFRRANQAVVMPSGFPEDEHMRMMYMCR